MEGGAVGHNFERDTPRDHLLTQMLPAKFGSIWPSCFRGEDFFKISQSEKRINLGGHVCWPNGTKRRSLIEDLTQMLPAKVGSILPSSFRGEDFFKQQPIRNKNSPWRPYLLVERNEMEKLYRGPYCQVWFHLAKLFQRRRLKYEKVNGRTTDAK